MTYFNSNIVSHFNLSKKNLDITYFHSDSHFCLIDTNIRFIVDVRKSNVDMSNGIAFIVDMTFYLIWNSISHIECELMFWDAIWKTADVFYLHVNNTFFLFYLIWIFFFISNCCQHDVLSGWQPFLSCLQNFISISDIKLNSDMTLWHVGINTSYVAMCPFFRLV